MLLSDRGVPSQEHSSALLLEKVGYRFSVRIKRMMRNVLIFATTRSTASVERRLWMHSRSLQW